MTIEFINTIHPLPIPETPKALVEYMMNPRELQEEFNKDNPGYWNAWESKDEERPGFFYVLSRALNHNESWIDLLNDLIKMPKHKKDIPALQEKIKEFSRQLYVGPMIARIPYFSRWANTRTEDAAEAIVDPGTPVGKGQS